MCRKWGTLLIIGLLVAGLVPYRTAVAQESAYRTPLVVHADDIRVSDGIVALIRGEDVFLPVREIALALEFPVELDTDRALASGWFLARSRRYRIDARGGDVTREGRVRSFESADFLTDRLADRGELYVRPEVLEHAWPVTLSVSRANLELTVVPDEPLPVQRRRAREKRHEDLRARQVGRTPDLPVRRNRYGWLSPPVVGIDLQARSGSDRQTNRQRIRWSQEIAGVNVFGGLSASGSSERKTEVRDARLTLRRFAGEESLPGGLERIEAGDVSGEAFGRIGSLGAGRGVSLSSFPLARGNAFDRHSLDGNAPPGWEVELYRDGHLMDFQQVDDDGRYRFDGVELGYGPNRFRVVLYGPQGQKRIRTETIDVGQTQARPGETNVRLDHIEPGRDFVPIDDGEEEAETEPGTALRVVHGVNRGVSLEAGVISLPRGNRQPSARYALIGAAGTLGATATRLRILGQEDGGAGLDLESTLRTGPATIRLGAGLFEEFTSPRVGFGTAALRGDLDLSVRGPVPLGDGNLWLGGRYGFEETVVGERWHRVDLSQRWNTGRIAWHNEVRYRVRDRGTGRWSARLNASDRLLVGGGDSFLWSAGLGYAQDAGVTDGRVRTRYRFSRATTVGVDVRHSVQTGRTNAGMDVTREWDNARLSLTADDGDGTGTTVGVRYSVGFGPGGGSGYAFADARAPQRGALAVHAFVDRDGDGEYDTDEPPVPDARLKGILGGRGVTDETGHMVMHDLEAHRSYPVQIERSSLVNPLWLPATDGRQVRVRPGSVPVVELPVEETGSVSGTVRLGSGGPEMSGIPLRLVDDSGRTVATTSSMFGGFFSFGQVPYGSYSLRLDDARGYALMDATDGITLDTADPMATGVAMHVESRSTVADRGQAAEPSAEPAPAERPGVVEGVVYVASGGERYPAGDVRIRLRDQRGDAVRQIRSGPDGRYRLEDLKPGDYEIHVSSASAASAPAVTIDRSEPERHGVDVMAEPGAWSRGVIEGTVLADQPDAFPPVEGARIRLLDARGQVAGQTSTARDGTFRFDRLATGYYDVHLPGTPDARAMYVRNVEVNPAEPIARPVDMLARKGRTVDTGDDDRRDSRADRWSNGVIGGRVSVERDGVRYGVNDVRLRLLDERGEIVERTVTSGNGTYRFDGLTGGAYAIHRPADANIRALYIRNIEVDRRQPVAPDVNMLVRNPGAGTVLDDALVREADDDVRTARTPDEGPDAFAPATWLAAQPDGRYTIQLAGFRSPEAARGFITRHGLAGRAIHVRMTHDGKPWFTVLSGGFETRSAARAALQRMPERLRTASPWIRAVEDVRNAIGHRVPRADSPSGPGAAIEDPGEWLVAQPPSRYTVQLMAASNEEAVRSFIETSGLAGRAIYVHSVRDGDPWFPVLYGTFSGRDAARAALDSLPEGIDPGAVWIRPFDDIQADLRAGEP